MRRGESANRHRASFLVQVGPQLAEMAALVGDGSDEGAAEAVAHDLRRLADTADRLGLGGIAERARQVAAGAGADGWRAGLRAVGRAAAASDGASPFGPLILVVPPDEVEAATAVAEGTAERIRVFASVDEADAELEIPAGVVLPAGEPGAIARWSSAGVPVVAWGRDPWPARIAAVAAGAARFLPGPLDLPVALEQLRHLAWQRAEAPVAAVLGEIDGLSSMLGDAGVRVIPPSEPVDLWSPDAAVVVGADAAARLPALRAHPGWARTAVVALADQPVPGADEVFPLATPHTPVVAHLRARLDRVRSVPVDRDPLTGLPNRAAALRSLDRWLAWSGRTGTPLSVALISLDGLTGLRVSLAVEAAIHRATADALTRTVRKLDILGRVGPSLYVAGLPSCRADEARKRLGQGLEHLVAALAADPRFEGVSPVLGIADSAHAQDRLLARAWENLALVRQGA